MRVVLDTNVVSSALLWGGTPERLIELAGEGSLELFTSDATPTSLPVHSPLAPRRSSQAMPICMRSVATRESLTFARRLPQAHRRLKAQRPVRLLAARDLPPSWCPYRLRLQVAISVARIEGSKA